MSGVGDNTLQGLSGPSKRSLDPRRVSVKKHAAPASHVSSALCNTLFAARADDTDLPDDARTARATHPKVCGRI